MKLNSNKKNILIVSDIHQDIRKLQTILEKELYDEVIFNGDFWDSHYYEAKTDWLNTIQFIKENIDRPNFYWIFGNHDLHYYYPNLKLRCSGWDRTKQKFLDDNFAETVQKIKSKSQYHIVLDNYLISHAGLHPAHIPSALNKDLDSVNKWLTKELTHAKKLNQTIFGPVSWIDEAGRDRGGRANHGGLVWLDWRNFIPIDNINQICGHTFQSMMKVSTLKTDNSINFCIDTNLNEYLLVNNGQITIKKYIDL